MKKKKHIHKTNGETSRRLFGPTRLEPRRLLNAEFDLLGGGTLVLDTFTDDSGDPNTLNVSQSGAIFTFEIGDGVWIGDDSPANITIVGGNQLQVDTGLGALSALLISNTDNDAGFDIEFGDFTFAGPLTFDDGGGVAFDSLTQQAATTLANSGNVSVDAIANVDLSNTTNDFGSVSIDNATDVSLADANAISLTTLGASNDATINAAGDVDLANVAVTGNLSVTTAGDLTDSGPVDVDGNAEFTANGGTSSILLDDLDVAGTIDVESTTSTTLVNATAVDLAAANVGTDLDVTATTGDITDSGTVIVAGNATFTSSAAAINLDQLDVTGSIELNAATSATIVNTGAIDLAASNVGTDLDVTATTGDITDSGTVTVGGEADFDSVAGAINLDQLDVTGSIGVQAATSATLVNTTAVDLKASNVGTDLDVTATTGDITDSGTVTVGGEADFDSVAGAINLDQLDVTGSIGVQAATSATLVNTTAVDLKASNVGTDLDVTATTGDITDSGTVTVGGEADFDSVAGAINLDQLDVTGSIGVQAATSATLVNTTAVDLKASNVGTDLDVTATTGDITDSGTVTVGGEADFDSVAGAVNLDQLDVTGSIGVQAATSATLVNTTAVDLKASNVGTDLDVTATTGDITDSGTVTVGGEADFDSVAGAINLDQLDVTGSIGVQAATSATLVNTTAVDLKASNVGTDLDVTATTGDITDSGTVTVGGEADFDSVAGAVNLDQLDVTGSIGVQAATSATLVNTTAVDLKASNVGTDLDVTATTGDITDSGTVTVGGEADFDSVAGAINLDQLDVTGSIGVQAATSATLVNTTAVDLKASSVGTDLDVTATTGDNTDSGTVTVGGDACFDSVAGAIDLNQVDAAGSVGLESAGDATFSAATVDFKASDVGGNLSVTTTAGNATQSDAIQVQGTTVFSVVGDICLTDPTNDFVGQVTFTADTVEVVDANDLDVGNITAVDDVFLRAGAGGPGLLSLNGDVVTNAATGQVLLQASNGVVQNVAFTITAQDLVLGGDVADEGSGDFILDSANVVARLAGELQDNLSLVNTTSLEVADLTYSSDCPTVEAVCGLDVGGNLVLNVTGNLTQSAAVIVAGTSGLTATGDICFTGADCTGDGINDNDFVGEVTASAVTIELVDANDLTTGAITAVNDIFLRSGDNGTGALTLNGNLTTVAGQVLLQSDSGATQAGGIITAAELLVGGDDPDEGTGDFELTGNNDVGTVAGVLDGTIHLVNVAPIVVDAVNYASSCGTLESAGDLTATTKVRLQAEGGNAITLNQAVVAETVFLQSTAGVTQLVTGTILADNLLLSGDGLFDLNDAANDVDLIAADINDTLDYLDDSQLTIAELDCDGITICGLNIVNDLNLTTNNGDLFQVVDEGLPTENSAAVIVGGNTVLDTGTGNICLVGGDCNDDGINENEFVGTLTIVTTGDVVIAENDDITIDSLVGTGSFRFIGNHITINTAINADQLLLQASDGVDYNNQLINVTDLLLTGQGLFDFGLPGDTVNSIDNLAADIDGDVQLLNGVDLEIADLTFVSDCGDVNVCGVNVDAGGPFAGNLTLNLVNADLTQTAAVTVEGAAALDAGTGVICLNGGDCTGDGLNDNDFVGLVTASGASIELVDINDLTVGDIIATNPLAGADADIFLRAGDGNPGALTLEGNLTATPGVGGAGQVLLQASNGISQNVLASVIDADQLLLGGDDASEGSGNVVLDGNNQIDLLAVDLQDDLLLVNGVSVIVDDLTYASVCGTSEAICGLNIGGNLELDVTGNLTQNAAVIVQGTSDLIASGFICLTGGDCTGDGLNDNDFVGEVTAIAMTVELVDINDLTVGQVTAIGGVDADIFLRAGDGNPGTLTLNGNLTTTPAGGTGQVLLQASNGIVQDEVASVISTEQLLIGGDDANEGTGNVVLDGNNLVDAIAADLQDDLLLVNGVDLLVDDLAYSSICGTTEAICGLAIGGNLDITNTGDLTQVAAVIVQGTTDLLVTGDICLTGGDCTGDGLNDNDFVGLVNASGGAAVEIVDVNDLNVGQVTAASAVAGTNANIYLRAGDGNPGTLTLNGNLTTTPGVGGTGQVLLQASNGIAQDELASVISADELLLGGAAADQGTGNVVLDGDNAVARVAALLQDDMQLVNVGDLEIADLDYISSCGTTEAICGLNIGGNLALDVDGNLTQSAAVIVGGTSDLIASGHICFTGGDCTGDGVNDNDFMGVVDASGTTVEIVDINNLTVGNITAAGATDADIFLRAGDVLLGTLAINGDVTTTPAGGVGQVLLQANNGIVQDELNSVITTNELLIGGDLAGEGSGNVILDGNNAVDQLAAELQNDLLQVNTVDLVVDDLTYSSVCGTTEAICGLDVAGNLTLDVDGDLSQSAAVIVAGTTDLIATGDICLTGGDCTGDGLNDNDFMGVVNAAGETVEIVDINDLTVGDVTAATAVAGRQTNIFLRAGDGGLGTLNLTGNLTTTPGAGAVGQTLLQANNGIVQDELASVISTEELLIGGDDASEGGGNVVLDGTNQVDRIAARVQNDLLLVNGRDLEVADLDYQSRCLTEEAICGLFVVGNLDLEVDGDLIQTAAVIVQGTTDLVASGDICLTGGDCTGDGLNDNDFVGQVTAAAETVELVDINDLVVGDITAATAVAGQQADIFLRAGDGFAGTLTINGNVTTTPGAGGTGQVLLQASNGIVQNAVSSVISTNELLLGGDDVSESSGNVVLDGANEVDQLAAALENDLLLVNNRAVDIADLDYQSRCGTQEAICGLNIGGNLTLNVAGDLTQSAAVIVQGTTDLVASGLICLTGGDCSGDGLNDNDFVGLVTASGTTVELVDINDLTTGDITAVAAVVGQQADVFLRAGDGNPGTLTLNGNVTTLPGAGAIGQVLLQANSGIVQDELASVISSDQLLLGGDDANEGSGDVELDGNNLVSSLAGNLQDSLLLVNSVSLEIGDLDYSSDCGTMEAICGLAIGGNLDLTVTGDLTQTAAVIVQGTTDLVVTGDICLIDGDCTGDGLNDNDFVGLVTAAGRIVEIADANDLNTGVITATDRIFLRSGDNGTGAITLDGNLTVTAANGEVLLQSDSGVTQDSGVINAFQLMVGGNDADEGSGVFLLDQANQVSELAGELLGGSLQLVNVGNLTVVASANYVNCAGGGEVFTGIQVHLGDQLETASFGDPNVDLEDTIQGAVGDVGDRYNPNPDFTEFLDTTNVGLAIANSGNLTLQHDGVAPTSWSRRLVRMSICRRWLEAMSL